MCFFLLLAPHSRSSNCAPESTQESRYLGTVSHSVNFWTKKKILLMPLCWQGLHRREVVHFYLSGSQSTWADLFHQGTNPGSALVGGFRDFSLKRPRGKQPSKPHAFRYILPKRMHRRQGPCAAFVPQRLSLPGTTEFVWKSFCRASGLDNK